MGEGGHRAGAGAESARVVPLASAEEHAAAARSDCYRLFARSFAFPEKDFIAAAIGGEVEETVREALGALPYEVEAPEPGALIFTGDAELFESEYIRLFDVGVGGPPCPLYGGLYYGDRMRVMEELVRFYNYFGLGLATERRELPDHLTVELEFLHYLTFREVEALHEGWDPAPFRRATRDVLDRHLLRSVPLLAARLEKHEAPRFFVALARALGAMLAADRAWAAAQAGSDPQ